MQDAVVGLRDHAASITAHSGEVDCRPYGIAAEKLVVTRNASKLHHAELHNEVVDKLLRLRFRKDSALDVALDVDVEERGDATDRHRRAVLRFDCCKIAEIRPLNRFARILSRTGNVVSVADRHLLHRLERTYLRRHLLASADNVLRHGTRTDHRKIMFLGGDKTINAVKRNTTVIADDASASIGVGKSGNDLVLAGDSHFRSVGIENTLIVSLMVFCEDAMKLRVRRVAIGFEGILRHLDTAIRHECTLQGLIGLESNNLFKILVEIAGRVGCYRRDHIRIHIENAALCAFLLLECLQLAPKGLRSGSGISKKLGAILVRSVVQTHKNSGIDILLPLSTGKSFPCGDVYICNIHGSYLPYVE